MTEPDPWQRLLESVESVWPASRYRDVGVVVGCSGGADSVALLRALHELRNRSEDNQRPAGFLVAAHFNHAFRGSESDEDARFVARLSAELGIPCEVGRGDAQRTDEQSARRDRREFFQAVLQRRGARYLATAHHLDDNVETVLYRLMRGTGPAGLAGISAFRPFSETVGGADFVVARPLLGIRRDPIRDALKRRGWSWRDDASNQSTQYDRNWIRNELVPTIESRFPQAVAAIDRAIDGQCQWAEAIDPLVERWLDVVRVRSRPLVLRCCRPDRFDRAIAIEALRRCWLELDWPLAGMKQTHWKALSGLLVGSGEDVITLPGAVTARRAAEVVHLTRRS